MQIQHQKIGRSRNWPKWKLAEVELAELEKKSWPKSKLAEVDRARTRTFISDSVPSVMKSVPRGPFGNALKLALEGATWSNSRDAEVRQERGWKFLMLFAANVASPRARRRTDLSCQVGGTVRGVCEGRVDQIVQSKRNLQRAGSHCEKDSASASERG